MDTPDKATQDKHFEEWEGQFDPPLRRLGHAFFKLLDAEGARIKREGLGPNDQGLLPEKKPTDGGDVSAK